MSQISSLSTGAGVVTSITLAYCPQFLIIDNTYTGTFDITNIDVSINGQSTVSIGTSDDIDAVCQIKAQSSVSDGKVMMAMELANGEINAPTLIRLTNEGSNTNAVYGVSTAVGTAPYRYSQFSLNSLSNQIFQDFDSLLINSSPTNIDRVQIQWRNGFSDSFSPYELSVLFRSLYTSEGSSQFSATKDIAWVNNEDGLISSAQVYTNSSGSASCTIGRI